MLIYNTMKLQITDLIVFDVALTESQIEDRITDWGQKRGIWYKVKRFFKRLYNHTMTIGIK